MMLYCFPKTQINCDEYICMCVIILHPSRHQFFFQDEGVFLLF